MPPDARRPHLLTVNMEDFFQVGAFNRYVQRERWYRFESRIAIHAEKTLDLLDRHGAKATFFVLGWVADKFPEVVRRVAERGHEVASKGYYHRSIAGMTPDEFRRDLTRAKAALERACGQRVVGYRVADGWFRPEDLWALDVLAEEGYLYDSSVCPLGRAFRGRPEFRTVHRHQHGGRAIWEVPVSTRPVLGFDLPVAGGNWLRQLPHAVTRRAMANWTARHDLPLVTYFHTWELDAEQPRFSPAGWLTRVRHYRNLRRMEGRLADHLTAHRFTSVADFLDIAPAAVTHYADPVVTLKPGWRETLTPLPPDRRTPVTIVVPLYNEELIIPYLANTLAHVRQLFAPRYDTRFLLVDDGSKDNTWASANRTFAGAADVTLVRHDGNKGVAAAIQTGIRLAETEVVCSMDSDCSYDPIEFLNMIPLLADGTDMVVASPYHPQGQVKNVPGWRLLLSKGASQLYRLVLRNRLHTYTSCFRVYRRPAVKDIPLRHGNFLGVVELLGRLDKAGGTVAEHPATLESRMLGRSKMKTVRTIGGHLKLLTQLWWAGVKARLPRRRVRPHSSAERDHALHLLIDTATTTPCHAALAHQPPPPAAPAAAAVRPGHGRPPAVAVDEDTAEGPALPAAALGPPGRNPSRADRHR